MWPLDNLLLGAEGGLRGEDLEIRAHTDFLLASASTPYEVRAEVCASFVLTGPLALQTGLEGRSGQLTLLGPDDTEVGVRDDLEFRFHLGPMLWL